MEVREFGRMFSDEKGALEYLWKKKGNPQCPACGFSEFYYLKGNRVRCKSCRKDLWPLKDARFSE
jgi:transposase-like protein